MMTRTLPALAALAALAVAGCGSSNDSSSSSTAAAPATAPAVATTTQSSTSTAAVAVTMQNIQFNPKSVTIKKGQKVTWVNNDDVDHNVTSTSGESIKSDNFGKGKSFSFTPTKAGTIKYTCTIHPGMDGTLIVQ